MSLRAVNCNAAYKYQARSPVAVTGLKMRLATKRTGVVPSGESRYPAIADAVGDFDATPVDGDPLLYEVVVSQDLQRQHLLDGLGVGTPYFAAWSVDGTADDLVDPFVVADHEGI